MNTFVGKSVRHSSLGDGTVIAVLNTSYTPSEAHLTISFSTGTSVFPLKSVGSIIEFIDPVIQQAALGIINPPRPAIPTPKAMNVPNNQHNHRNRPAHSLGNGNINTNNKLEQSFSYGTRAEDIYRTCCQIFTWDPNMIHNFTRQQRLYAEAATSEGYDVWFISHSNWTQTAADHWSNEISDNLTTIKETYDPSAQVNYCSYKNNRVVFAKDGNGQYVFLGVYAPTSHDQTKRIHTFALVNSIYP